MARTTTRRSSAKTKAKGETERRPSRRALWTGQLRLALVSVPVALVSATRASAHIAFHQIQIFQAPLYDNEDEETIAENEEITVRSLSLPPTPFLLLTHGNSQRKKR